MSNGGVPMIRAEVFFRQDQNLNSSHREYKKGHYFTIRWNKKDFSDQQTPIKVTLNYRQAKTGRAIQKRVKTLSVRNKQPLEIQIIGDDYAQNGRVLAWKATIKQNENILFSQKSFLWK